MRRISIGAGLLLVTLFVTADPARAQSGWDAGASTGGWWGRPATAPPEVPGGQDWFAAWVGSVSLGRYWSPNFKTEIDATWAGQGERYVLSQVTLPGERTPRFISSEEAYTESSLAALVTWQFGRNWWVHPFLQGGVSWDRERVETETFLPINTGVPVFETSEETRS